MPDEGCFANDEFVLTDIKPKNVLRIIDDTMFVIDADVRRK